MTSDIRTGKCLCGAVQCSVVLTDTQAHVCHCTMCRKTGAGGPCISVDCESVTIRGEDSIQWYQSSDYAERAFCKKCGTSLFFRMTNGDDYMNVCTAVLDDERGITLRDHIYIDSKPAYYDFADTCPRYTEAEFRAKIQGDLNDTAAT